MAKQDGRTNPFDGSGGGSASGHTYDKAKQSPPPGTPHPRSNVPPGGEMPFVTPTSPPGNPTGAGSQGVSAPLPVTFTR